MRKVLLGSIVILASTPAAWGQIKVTLPAEEPASKADTVSVSVHKAPGKYQFRLDFFVVNSMPVAGMPTPVKVTAKNATMAFDSISFTDGRVEYFQLKVQNADTANQTLLVGLIADLSGSKPPMAPGRGRAFSVYYTADKAITADAVEVSPIIVAPANKLEFNTALADNQIGSTIPTFVQSKAAPDKKKEKAAE